MTRLQARNIEHYPIIAPSIRSSLTDSEQNPLASERWGRGGLWKWRVFDSSLVGARILIAARRLGNAFVGRWGHPIQNGDSPEQRIYAPHGAMVILSRAFFEAGGFLDLSVPVFAEELSLAETARRLSLPVTFCPDLRVEHREHGTLGKALTRQTHTWARQAHRYLREAYFGENPEDLDVIRQRSRAPSIADVVASEVSS